MLFFSGGADHSVLDQVQRSLHFWLGWILLLVHQDHPKPRLVPTLSCRLSFHWYWPAQLSHVYGSISTEIIFQVQHQNALKLRAEHRGFVLDQLNVFPSHVPNYLAIDLLPFVWFIVYFFWSGVFENAFGDPMVWLTALLAACVAILPAMAARALSVVLNVQDKHKVGPAWKLGLINHFIFFLISSKKENTLVQYLNLYWILAVSVPHNKDYPLWTH